MKLVMRNWKWLAGLMVGALICATYLVAQIHTKQNGRNTKPPEIRNERVSPPDEAETAAAALLIEAVNAGDVKTAVEILHAFGVAEDTLLRMATRLGKPPAPVKLTEPFLKASFGALAVWGKATSEKVRLITAPILRGYERPVLVVRRLGDDSVASYDTDLAQCALAPIAVLNVKLEDPRFIRFFLWYDRYAESLHSVALNGENLNNAKLSPERYHEANRTLNALFQLIKARKPDAFVWLGVVKQDSKTDELWLKAMTFKPDGLQIWNLRQFHSPFGQTRQRYAQIVGADMPMMVVDFYGQKAALQAKWETLSATTKIADPKGRRAAEANALAQLGSIGAAARQDLAWLEAELQSLGYRGLSMHWLLLAALANSGKATSIDKSDLIDPRARLFETYLSKNDYAQLFSLAAEMISKSAPGDMDWTVAKVYEGAALLSQTPPRLAEGIAVLDEVLSFDFKDRPGRDYYVLAAVEWRLYAVSLTNDIKKAKELVQWVKDRDFRKDLKSDFLKKFEGILTLPTTSSN